jgi:hypothetical protein
MKKLLAIILFVAGSASAPAAAATPSGATMLAPGVYTTADISRRCQTYTGRRVRGGGMDDTSRQAVFIACVQKLYNEQYGGASAAAAPVEQGFVSRGVSMPIDTWSGGFDRASSPFAGGGGA